LWQQYGHQTGLAEASWPVFDADVARAEKVVMPVQVNGKVRGRIAADPDASDAELEALALADPGVQPYLKDREVTKVVIARGRLISIVVR
jgi:leucyl-tRNA synthetase